MATKTRPKTLIIVESPTKARTIERFLDGEYEVIASNGHVRDLPAKNTDVPKELRHKVVGVDVANDFAPVYVVPDNKDRNVAALKKAAKEADRILVATDEDREGESIGWHVLQLIKPKKGVEVSRIVFHEVTKEAILEALRTPRQVDEDLVRSQETRRILDRLFGYTLSPLVGRKVQAGLSAGRVQSVAVRLCVMRERERMEFVAAEYWDLQATLAAGEGQITMDLHSVGDRTVADGNSFDSKGVLQDQKRLWLKEGDARSLVDRLAQHKPWKVEKVKSAPGVMTAPPPFTTATLQIEANRKLGFSSSRTMSVAQRLFEGKDLGKERVGLITYHRTDSLTLADKAIEEARRMIRSQYGAEYLPDQPRRYKTKSKGAQEAHEAIRPTGFDRRPADLSSFLDNDELRLYELIWKRTMACQMKDARVERTTVDVRADDCVFRATGKQILFAGFLRAYVEGSDDPNAELGDKEKILPPLKEGEELDLKRLEALQHFTKPPARYTEASLVKKLEDEGIGRPSTYASIIQTILSRGYVFLQSKALVPTFQAFAATELLEQRFGDLVDLKFTALMETELDEVAEGKMAWTDLLKEFYFGSDGSGIAERVEGAKDDHVRSVTIGEGLNVRFGKHGAYLSDAEGRTADVPEGQAPADLTEEMAAVLLEQRAKAVAEGPKVVAVDADGNQIALLSGRFGPYLQVSGETPKNVSLPKELNPEDLDEATALGLASLPRVLGMVEGEEVSTAIGRYGPYVKKGGDYRNLSNWRDVLEITLEGAQELLAQPKQRKGGAGYVLADLGEGIQVKTGRYGPYVTDGSVNATLPKGLLPEAIGLEAAKELLEKKRAAGPSKFKRRRK